MKACLLFKISIAAFLLTPCFSSGQNDAHLSSYTYHDAHGDIISNVPLNEINPHAWRHFHKLFPGADGGEYWFASEDGFQVCFTQNGYHYQAFFDGRGAYRYSLHYYGGKEMPRDPGQQIMARYPDFRIDVVTEVNDGVNTIYLVKLVNASTIRTVSVCDGKMEIIEELGGMVNTGGAVPSAITPLISKRSDQ